MSVTFSDLTEFKNLETNMATIMNVKVSDEKCFYILLITACPETGGDTQPGGGGWGGVWFWVSYAKYHRLLLYNSLSC